MSKGVPKTNAIYQDQYVAEKLHGITIQKETPTLTIAGDKNDVPSGPATEAGKMTVSTTRRQRGKAPMTVTVKWTETTPDGYKPGGSITLPALNNAIQKAILTATAGVTEGTYMGQKVVYMSHRSQKIR